MDGGSGQRSNGAFEEVPPDPSATIESLRALGYSPASAIADLIDNSLAAGARTIDVKLHWAGADRSWCAVVDDGVGMSEERLRNAMRIGSSDPLAERVTGDLGRFGFGLKTASFSQCRELTVSSSTARASRAHVRSWDLDHVRKVGRWELRRGAPDDAQPVLGRITPKKHGTVVLWRRLDDLVEAGTEADDEKARDRFLERVSVIEAHLAMTFERFLQGRQRAVRIRLNGRSVKPWDPFVTNNDATQRLPPERLILKGHTVVISPYVLPHRSKLTEQEFEAAGGPYGWNAQQGFYLYRANRLITPGDWLGLGLTRDDSHNLARIAIDVPTELDLVWSLDVTKATVRAPAALRDDLKRMANSTRKRARAVLSHRGAPVGGRRRNSVVPVWHQRRRHGELVFRINRSHPLVAELVAALGEQRRFVGQILDLIEETVPVPVLPTTPPGDQHLAFEGRPPAEVVKLAGQLYESFLRQGLSRAQAGERLLNCEPFNEYPDILRAIMGGA